MLTAPQREGRAATVQAGGRGTHVGVAQLVLAVGPNAGDGCGPRWLGKTLGCPGGPHGMAAAKFWAVEET